MRRIWVAASNPIFFALLGISLLPAASIAQPGDVLLPAEVARYLHAGMIDARSKLRTGSFRATGTWVESDSRGESLSLDWEVFCAFDHDRNLFRFDQQMELPDALPQGVEAETQPATLSVVKTKLVTDPEGVIYWCDEESAKIELWGPTFEPSRRLYDFDVRCAGLLGVYSFGRGLTVEEFCKAWSSTKVREVTNRSGLQRIEFHNNESEVLFAQTIDERRGFTPIHAEFRDLALAGPSATFDQAELISKGSTTWKQINEQWVPASILLVYGKDRRELAFEWESVNEPIPDKLFQKEGLGLPGETFVSDHRLGKEIFIGRLDGKPTAYSDALPLSANRDHGWLWVAVVGLVLMAGLAVGVKWKRNAR
ncbi:MAG: hypothetical protein KDB05_07595 [Planctomycetales bacterium]|nr:hypothetical protein [Planctomycetales bacterium]MCA9142633.1 hypothetical protein [Planctomycetales bacterium]